jgi:hypothetical protein
MDIATLVLSLVALVTLVGTGLVVKDVEDMSVVITFLVMPILLAIVILSIIQIA